MVEQIKKRYQLRHAAGLYWLLDMGQDGRSDKKPVILNESGARIWKLLCANASVDQIVESFQEQYGISAEQARDDVLQYIQMLREQGIEM